MKNYLLLFLLTLSNMLFGQSVTTIEAEDYNAESGTQIVSGPPVVVGYVVAGDWMRYDINFGSYTYHKLTFHISSINTGETFEIRQGSTSGTLLATVTAPNTGSFGTFAMVDAYIATTGSQQMFIVSTAAGFGPDFNKFDWLPIVTPSANAGTDLTVTGIATGSTGGTTLVGTAFDEGSITSTVWSKVSGPSVGTIISPTSLTTTVSGLAPGFHVFRLTVTDNASNTGTDDVGVLVRYCPGGSRIQLNPSGGSFRWVDPGYTARTFKGYEHILYGAPSLTYLPGDTLELEGTWAKRASYAELFGIDGTPGCPLTIVAEGTNLDSPAYVTKELLLRDCNYITITGRPYGNTDTAALDGTEDFRIRMGGEWGITLGGIGRTSNIIADWLFQENVTYASHFKTDFQDLSGYADSLGYVWPHAPNLKNIELRYIYTRNVRQDGHYLGSTDPSGYLVDSRTYSWPLGVGPEVKIHPQILEDIYVHHCTLENLMRTGIQLSGAMAGRNIIEKNIIKNAGLEFNTQQGTCISLGGLTTNTYVQDNYCRTTFTYNWFDLGGGRNYWINNTGDSAGYMNDHLDQGMWDGHFPHLDRATAIATLISEGKLTQSGNLITNTENSGNNIASMAITTKPTFPVMTKSVVVQNNFFGKHSGNLNSGNGAVAFRDYGPAYDWGSNNVVCGLNAGAILDRELMDHDNNGGTAEIAWPTYSGTCITFGLKFKTGKFKKLNVF